MRSPDDFVCIINASISAGLNKTEVYRIMESKEKDTRLVFMFMWSKSNSHDSDRGEGANAESEVPAPSTQIVYVFRYSQKLGEPLCPRCGIGDIFIGRSQPGSKIGAHGISNCWGGTIDTATNRSGMRCLTPGVPQFAG